MIQLYKKYNFIEYYSLTFPECKMFQFFLTRIETCDIYYLKNTKLEFTTSLAPSISGCYSSNHIKVKYSDQSLLLHEFGHALLDYSPALAKRVYFMYGDFITKYPWVLAKNFYGLSNSQEFFCELISNNSFYCFVARFYSCNDNNENWIKYKELAPVNSEPNLIYSKLFASSPVNPLISNG